MPQKTLASNALSAGYTPGLAAKEPSPAMSAKQRPWYTYERIHRFLLGNPIPSSKALHERLSPKLGLPVFAADNLSSISYATEAILAILILGGLGAMRMQIWVSGAIVLLIGIIAYTYQQTIRAYPKGGGSYIVTSENIGPRVGLLAGSALMVDYVLTVAVSIAASATALTSAFPSLHPHLVPISIVGIALVAWANLRGVRESGALFAIPTYGFLVGIFTMLAFGFWRGIEQGVPEHQMVNGQDAYHAAGSVTLFLLLRAFSAGCTALTGIEAVADGVPAFKPPEAKNAILVLRWMVVLLAAMLLGVGLLVQFLPNVSLLPVENPEHRTLISQIAAFSFGGTHNFGFYLIAFMTAAILMLATNTAFADFPRLSSFMARDGFLPRALARQGDRLVFHNGILLLAIAAAVLVWHFKGELDLLLPLYAVSVFLAFTLSQLGMIAHWRRLKAPQGWQRRLAVNVVGAIICGAVMLVILFTKFYEGAWIIAVLLVILYTAFSAIKARYAFITRQLAPSSGLAPAPTSHRSLLMVSRVHKGVIKALEYARLLDPNCLAVHVTLNEKALPDVQRDWKKYGKEVPLVVLSSPYRSLIEPVLDYVDGLLEADPHLAITVIVPEAISSKPHHKLLHDNVASQLKRHLLSRPNVVVSTVRYLLD